MSIAEQKALKNAAASSAMEGLPLNADDLSIIQKILDGKITLQDYLMTLKDKTGEVA